MVSFVGLVERQCRWEAVVLSTIMSCLSMVVDSPGGRPESAHRLRVPMVVKTAGRVGCRRSWYGFAVEI
jgi:hypothetical protein